MFSTWHSPLSGSNHYGIAGYYAMQALKENMIVSWRVYLPARKLKEPLLTCFSHEGKLSCGCLIHFRACHLPIHPHWWSPHVAKRWTLGHRIKRYCHCQILKLLFPPLVVHPRHQPHQRGSSRQRRRQLCPGHGHISSSAWKGELSFLYTW